MQQKKSTKRTKKKQGIGKEDIVNLETKQAGITDVHEVVFFRNKILRRTLCVLPWVSIVGAMVSLAYFVGFRHGGFTADSLNYYAGLVLAPIGLFLFQALAKRVPQAFISIEKRNIVEALKDRPTLSRQEKYQEFLHKFDEILNHPMQWVIGGVLAAVMFWQEGIVRPDMFNLRFFRPGLWYGLLSFGMDAIRLLLFFMIGVLIWRMIVIGVYIWRLGKNFRINPQLGHPDACGGLEPIGNLCLWIVLLLALPMVNLIVWILPSQLQPNLVDISWIMESHDYIKFYPALLLLLILLSLISFFIPLWSIHEAMLQSRMPVKMEMEGLAQSITEIEKTLLDQAKTIEQTKVDELQKRLKIMQEIYQRNKNYPTWPFNVKGLTKFFSMQLLPLLVSLKLTEPIVNWLVSLVTKKGS